MLLSFFIICRYLVSINPKDFLEAGISFFPDQKKDDIYYFTSFICYSLEKLTSKNKINSSFKQVLEQWIKDFIDKNTEQDNSYIWYFFSVLIVNMVLFDLLSIKDAKDLHKTIDGEEWNDDRLIEDIKWFLHDFNDYSETRESKTIKDEKSWKFREIQNALKMPDTLKKKNCDPKKITYTRLVVEAIIRSISFSIQNIKGNRIEKYTSVLKEAYKAQTKAIEESNNEVYEYNPDLENILKKDDFLAQCK